MIGLRKFVVYLAAFLAGILFGFFIVFNVVFSDRSGAHTEIATVFLLIVIVYGAVGTALNYFLPGRIASVSLMLSLPGIAVVLLYSIREAGQLPFNLSVLVLTVIGTWLGALLGNRLAQNKNRPITK